MPGAPNNHKGEKMKGRLYPNLSWALQQAGITIEALGYLLGVSQPAATMKLQKGLRPMEQLMIAKALDLDPAWLFAAPQPVPMKRTKAALKAPKDKALKGC
jgi:lambda repressor-like predicted transcriptional regulator